MIEAEVNREEERILEFTQISRIALYSFVLLLVLLYQLQYLTFLNFEILYPIYLILTLGFFCEFIFRWQTSLDHSVYKIRKWLAVLLPLDIVLVSFILYSTKLQNTLFLFFYIYLIFICGLVFRTRGSLWLSVFTSILFSLFLATQTQISSESRVLIFCINNIAFFTVAVLSGYLSEQLFAMSTQIQVQRLNLAALKNINQLIINNMQSGLMTVGLEGEVIQINPSGVRILGQKPTKISSIKGLSNEINFIIDTFRTQSDFHKQNIEMEFDFQGVSKTLDFSFSKLFVNEKVLSAFVLIFQDISEKKRLEEKLKQKEKLAAIGQLAAGIAHEIRNPLASMSGSIQMLKSYIDKMDKDQIRLMNIALRETDRLNDLITEFLEFVKPEIKTDEKVDLNHLLNEVLEVIKLNPNLNSHVSQKINLGSNLLIKGNSDKLKQVFLNMIMNAYHAMSTKEQGAVIEVKSIRDSDGIKIIIADNGTGMSEETKARIFEPFFTTKSKGTGLGLAIVHKILEAHEADIELNSKENIGTEFTINFKRLALETVQPRLASEGGF